MGEQKTFAKVKLDFESNHRIGDALAIPISYIDLIPFRPF